MAKITPLEPVKNITGTLKLRSKKFTFSTRFDGDAQYMRNYGVPSYATPGMIAQRTKYTAAIALYPLVRPEFKQALDQYAKMWNKQHRKSGHGGISGYNAFVMALTNSIVDPQNLTQLADITSCYGATVRSWITSGLLPDVEGTLSNAFVI